jgi:flagellar biosynthesis chaperone FliJ
MKEQAKPAQTQPNTNENQAKESKTVSIQKAAPKSELDLVREELEMLKKQMEEGPKSLEDKIKFYQEKQVKINKLAKLDAYAEGLVRVGQEAQEESETDEFFSERYSVRVSRKPNKYDRDWTDVLTIQNPVLVVEILGYALERINQKREQLKNEIEA